ncbi:MAG: glycosyl transferase family 1 [Clostridia bacterium]|nr:glycosyl transferase family 1 [Clostridia bacterium]
MSSQLNKKIICLSSVDWFPIPTRKQQVMSRIPKEVDILYVEPPVTLISPLKDKNTWKKFWRFMEGPRKLTDNIMLYTPPPILPFGNIVRGINWFNQWWDSLFIKQQVRKLGFENSILWTYMPNSADIAGRLKEDFLIYDCIDEHAEYGGFIKKETVNKMEADLLRKSDLSFVTVQGLYDAKVQYNSNMHIIPNGANVELFMECQKESTKIAEEMTRIPHPIVGFLGVIQPCIDTELLEKIAKAHPEWSVVLIGPLTAGVSIESLLKHSNVYHLGRKNPEELPSYMKAFDICLNPFKINNLTLNVSPLKFFEYLATGKPVVSVDMPGVHGYEDIIYIGKDHENFIEEVERALEEDSPERIEKRLEAAKQNSWEARTNCMLKLLQQNIKGE